MRISQLRIVMLSGFALVSCNCEAHRSQSAANAGSSQCPARRDAPSPLPGVSAPMLSASYWLKRYRSEGIADPPLLDKEAIDQHNQALMGPNPAFEHGQVDLMQPLEPAFVRSEILGRLNYLKELFHDQKRFHHNGDPVKMSEYQVMQAWQQHPLKPSRLHLALEPIQLHCAPLNFPFYDDELDPEFDHNRCSLIRPQEALQVLSDAHNGFVLVRSAYTLGWIRQDAALSAPLSAEAQDSLREASYGVIRKGFRVKDKQGKAIKLPSGTRIPLASSNDPEGIYVGSRQGLFTSKPPSASSLQHIPQPFTRAQIIREAFRFLGQPYGWGGYRGGYDCSRFILTLLQRFGLLMPRHSSKQVLATTFSVDVQGASRTTKLALLDRAQQAGLVILHLPGHIMLYLGRNHEQGPMAMHALAAYREACAEAPPKSSRQAKETRRVVNQITVSDLELGQGSHKGSLIDRIDRIGVFGHTQDDALLDLAQWRPAKTPELPSRCKDSAEHSIAVSPLLPSSQQALRVIVSHRSFPGPGKLQLLNPKGEVVETAQHVLNGPPRSVWTEVSQPQAGLWHALYGDGSHISACQRIRVRPQRMRYSSPDRGNQAWSARRPWDKASESLYAAFVEQLFKDPEDQSDVTWNNLHGLLRDPTRNLLHNHLGHDEDDKLRLQPDCADLPYFLRAYAAWKLGLPFGFRACNRGRTKAPTCSEVQNHSFQVDASNPVNAFRTFIRKVKNTVHSASARTAPQDDNSDLYPVALTRNNLRPGTVYADPYGHLLVVARWLPQSLKQGGRLIAADAQPDGTIGRRRFWRGSFLFTPETHSAGAGFKAWRPLLPLEGQGYQPLANQKLKRSTLYRRFDDAIYQRSREDFYADMDGLINPLPRTPQKQLGALVDALEETVQRRLVSVRNALDYKGKRPGVIAMPKGYAIFETVGAWEDFASPSRDMRLLISIDAVQRFPERVAKDPQRFGIDPAEQEKALQQLQATIESQTQARSFHYKRSDGSEQTLSLWELIQRQEALEMAYNPNDCVEIRWGAAPKSQEISSCTMRAPLAQRKRMQAYRPWFTKRERPPRNTRN